MEKIINKKQCENCAYLITFDEKRLHYTQETYHCKLHNVRVGYPESQFCGDKHWFSIKASERLHKLKQLGI